jgi:hypothetical protein
MRQDLFTINIGYYFIASLCSMLDHLFSFLCAFVKLEVGMRALVDGQGTFCLKLARFTHTEPASSTRTACRQLRAKTTPVKSMDIVAEKHPESIQDGPLSHTSP